MSIHRLLAFCLICLLLSACSLPAQIAPPGALDGGGGPAQAAGNSLGLLFTAFLTGGLLLIGLYHFSVFALRPGIRQALYFSLLCLALALYIAGAQDNLLLALWPNLSPAFGARLSALSLAFALPLFMLFIRSIFPQEIARLTAAISIVAGALFGLLVFIAPRAIFTVALLLYAGVIAVAGLYMYIALFQIIRRRRPGAYFFLFGLTFLTITVLNDALDIGLLGATSLMPSGIFIFICTQALLLARLFTGAFEQIETVSAEMELRIETRTRDLAQNHQELLRAKTGLEEEVIRRRMAEADLVKSKEKAESANEAKSAFLANMSHELRTPLNAILGFSQLLRREKNLSAEQRENLEIIIRSGDHLLNLINDVLEFSKIEAGRVVVQPNAFDLYHLLEDLANIFRMRAEDKDLKMTLAARPDLPQYVAADEGKLRQILINFLSNALKFTEQGEITLRAWKLDTAKRASSGRPAARLHFEVEDEGIGIPARDQQRIFEPFLQAGAQPNNSEGTGLGLTISRKFVQLMGGEIGFRSQPGHGSLFWFEIPVEIVQAGQVAKPKVDRRIIGVAPGQPVFRLLVAEDNTANRVLLVKLLQPLGFTLREVSNGEEAVAMWSEWQPHLVWMDARMPVMNGSAATKQIKALSKAQGFHSVVIGVSASAFAEDRTEMMAAGCDDFVRMPFRETQIYTILERHLKVRFLYSAEQTTPIRTVHPAHANRTTQDLTVAVLTQMPPEWLIDLRQAAVVGDITRMAVLIQNCHDANPALNAHLSQLSNEFRHDEILRLVDLAIHTAQDTRR